MNQLVTLLNLKTILQTYVSSEKTKGGGADTVIDLSGLSWNFKICPGRRQTKFILMNPCPEGSVKLIVYEGLNPIIRLTIS